MLIFRSPRDCERFERKIGYYSEKCHVFVKAYSIMGNHFHLMVKELHGGSITLFMQRLGQSFAVYFNIKYHKKGPVFDSRFNAKAVDDFEYYKEVKKYILKNPIKIKSGDNYSKIK